MISKRTQSVIDDAMDAIKRATEANDRNLMLDRFEASELGQSHYAYSYAYSYMTELTVNVGSASEIEDILIWLREHENLRVISFEDHVTTLTAYREYRLEDREDSTLPSFRVKAYFTEGTCEFVEEETGEFELVPGKPATAEVLPTRKAVTKKVLVCNDGTLPEVDTEVA